MELTRIKGERERVIKKALRMKEMEPKLEPKATKKPQEGAKVVEIVLTKMAEILVEKSRNLRKEVHQGEAKEKWWMNRTTLESTSHYSSGCIMG